LTADLPKQTDVLIVGSGLTGLSAALRLADAGRDTTVIDSAEIGFGASSRNGGMVSADIKGGVDAIWKRHGEEVARGMWESSARSVDLVASLAGDSRVNAGVTTGGMIGLTSRNDRLRGMENELRWYREKFGVDWELLGPDRIGEVVGNTDLFVGGYYEPEGFGIQPAEFTFGMAKAVRDAGAALIEACAANKVERTTNGFTVTTDSGRIKAGEVLVATNGYTTGQPVAQLARKIVPIGSYIIVTEPLPEAEAKAIFPTNSMSHTSKRLLNYMRRTPDDRILIGGRRNLHTDLDLADSATDLRRRLVEFWPSLADKEITHVWGGKLGVPFDLTPHMGQVDGVWYAMGYGGHGVGLSTQLGHEFAGMLLGEDPPSVFTRIPHRGRWYYRGRPWFLTPASALYRALDRVGR
jgi:glycine/D-amino acid oxidase-like deaminating enzyme